MLNAKEKVNCALRLAKPAIETLRKRNKAAEFKKTPALSKSGLHYVEPRRLPSDSLVVSKRLYSTITASKKRVGFPTRDLGSLYVAKISKGIFDALVTTHQQSCYVYNYFEYGAAKRSFHTVRKFISNREKLFKHSLFVKQTLKSIAITLRFAKGNLRFQDYRNVRYTAETTP